MRFYRLKFNPQTQTQTPTRLSKVLVGGALRIFSNHSWLHKLQVTKLLVSSERDKMEVGWGILIGLLGIGVPISISIFFGLHGFRRGITEKLSELSDKLTEIKGHTESIGSMDRTLGSLHGQITTMVELSKPPGGTVEGTLEKLGKVKVTAEPGENVTNYHIEVSEPVLKDGFIPKIANQDDEFQEKRSKTFEGMTIRVTVLTPKRVIVRLPSTNPTTCSEFMTYFIKWLDSKYIKSLSKNVEEFEKIQF